MTCLFSAPDGMETAEILAIWRPITFLTTNNPQLEEILQWHCLPMT